VTLNPAGRRRLARSTQLAIGQLFERLDYARLGPIYCDKGGRAFWRARRRPCERLGVKVAEVLRPRLKQEGRSLYVGAGVAELPALVMERLELGRAVAAFNLRRDEVRLLNHACRAAGMSLSIQAKNATTATGRFDHLWIVSVLNDPERYPELAALAYGRANPATFDLARFRRERVAVCALAEACLNKLRVPGLVTTSVEEIPWITEWCANRRIACVVEEKDYPTAIVEDPICFIRVGP
jgi:hypothetical protein